MQIDVTEVIHNYGWKVLLACLSIFGTTVLGYHHYVDARFSHSENVLEENSKAIADIHSDTSRIEAKVDTVIDLLKNRK